MISTAVLRLLVQLAWLVIAVMVARIVIQDYGTDDPVTRAQATMLVSLVVVASFAAPVVRSAIRLRKEVVGARSKDRMREVSRHEAAHAVSALALGAQLLSVSTLREEDGSGGKVDYAFVATTPGGAFVPRTAHVAIALAGVHGSTACGDSKHGSPDDDYATAWRFALTAAAVEGRRPSEVIDEASALAARLVASLTQAVERLADELGTRPRRIPGDTARSIIEATPGWEDSLRALALDKESL